MFSCFYVREEMVPSGLSISATQLALHPQSQQTFNRGLNCAARQGSTPSLTRTRESLRSFKSNPRKPTSNKVTKTRHSDGSLSPPMRISTPLSAVSGWPFLVNEALPFQLMPRSQDISAFLKTSSRLVISMAHDTCLVHSPKTGGAQIHH